MAPRSIVRWDVRPAENVLDVLEQADIHLAGEGQRIVSWSEYAGELVLIVESSGSPQARVSDPAAARQTRVTGPKATR